MSADFLVNAYLDANILLGLAAVMALLGRVLMQCAGFGGAFRAQLSVVNGVLLTLVLVPLIAVGSQFLFRAPLPSASDILVAQFLNGQIDMSATDFGNLLGLRQRLVDAILTPKGAVAMALLATGALALATVLWQVVRNIARLRAILGSAYTIRKIGRISVLSSDRVTVPFTARGRRGYCVVVPVEMLEDSGETKIAIGHELQHIRQKDVEWEIALELLRPLFFLNPAYWAIRRQIRSLREYACDQEFLARSGVDRRSYGKCLIDVAQRSMERRGHARIDAFSVPLIDEVKVLRLSGSSNLGRRIHALTRTALRRPSRALVLLLVLPLSGMLVVSAQSIQQPLQWSHDRIMLTTVINLERIHSLNAALTPFAAPDATGN